MKKIISFLFAFSLLYASSYAYEHKLSFPPAGSSITSLYLKDHSLDTIKSRFWGDQFDKQFPIMKKIMANENDVGFFGYHGCSVRYRIFQDILRAVFEESLGYEIPSDFQFLRIPGDKMFDLKDGKYSFFKLFDRKEPNEKNKNIIINGLFIKPFNESYGCTIQVSDLTQKEKKEMWAIQLEFLEVLDSLAMEDYYSYEFEDDGMLASLDPFSLPIPFGNEGEQQEDERSLYLESARKKLKMVIDKLDALEQENSLESLSPSTSMAQMHKIFMRILKKKHKYVDSGKVKYHIEESFKFRNIYDSIYSLSYTDFSNAMEYFLPYNDHIPGQQSRIVCLNLPLFGNFERLGECSLYVFLSGGSIAGGDNNVTDLLQKYFDKIGLQKELVYSLQDIAIEEIEQSKQTNGSILQFFDESENLYQGADLTTYVSHSFGIPLRHLEPSQLHLNEHPLQINNLDLQLRLIPCNQTTLNPYSFLRVIRYDSQNPEISKRIITRMREKLKDGVVNVKKLEIYKDKMDKIWSR